MTLKEAELELPDTIFDSNPRGFLEFLNLQGRPLGDNRWAVRPSNDKRFISHHLLADNTEFMNRFDHMTLAPMDNVHLVLQP